MRREQLRQTLAKELMTLQVGDQIPTIRRFTDQHNSSLGTIQSILVEFEENGAVEIDRRGWMGTILKKRNLSKLWSIARNGSPLVIAFPLPSTRICEGLATGVKELLSRSEIETFLIFLRGSRNRLQALHQSRCHAIVVSSFSANEMCGPKDLNALELPPCTFVKEHRVFYTTDFEVLRGRRLRVAVDRNSADIQRLTELEFEGMDVEYVPTTFMLYPQMLEQAKVDAAVWDVDETIGRLSSQVSSRPLSDRVLMKIGTQNTQASFVVGKDDQSVAVVIRECLSSPELLEIQKAVMLGKRVPEY